MAVVNRCRSSHSSRGKKVQHIARTATTRSVSLAPEEARLADELAADLAGGNFSQLTQLFLATIGTPLKQRIQELRESGLDPSERLFVSHPTPPDTDEQIRDFYTPSAPSLDYS